MKCQRCQRDISENETYTYLNETLCDDCYMDAMSPVKSCDPWAVYSATRTRESSGLKGEEGLTPFQKEIYEFIKNRGKASAKEVMTNFSITQHDLESVFATLRHCELVRGQKEGDKVHLVSPLVQVLNEACRFPPLRISSVIRMIFR
jgi:late competence protein required for DNA uptake (superfamily II DNA/RNA helicase)